MPNSRTASLIAELPESLWTEGVRRLKRVPELGILADNDEMRQAFVAHARTDTRPRSSASKSARMGMMDSSGAAASWRPGPLALVAYAVQHPECQGEAETWLMGAGRDRLGAAYAAISSGSQPLHPLEEALPAAIALKLRMSATSDWTALAADAADSSDRWRLTLQYLWGLWQGDHRPFFAAFMAAGHAAAALAAQCLAVNLSPAESVEFVAQSGLDVSAGHWLSFVHALDDLGEHECARQILRPRAAALSAAVAKDGPPAWNPLQLNITAELESSLLVAATDDFTVAHPVLTAAWNQLRQLRATVAGHIGRLALKAGDLVVAQAGYQEAYSERPEEPAFRVGLADVLVKLGRSEEAITLLAGQPQPAAHLVAAQAHLALDQVDRARENLADLAAAAQPQPDTLALAAEIHAELGDPGAAADLMQRAAMLAGTNVKLYLDAARRLLGRSQPGDARQMAIEAAALAPESGEAREMLGQTLLACGQPDAAMPHFESALAFEPGRHSAALGLATAALAAGQPERAIEASAAVLDSLQRSRSKGDARLALEGQAHTLLGQALSNQKRADEAFEHFRQASALVPTNPEPWRAMARHYVDQGEAAQALATLEAGRQALAVLESAEAAPLLADLADRYIASDRPTEAILALREACAADPQAAAPHRRLGTLLRRQGSTAEAVDLLRHALKLRPGDAPTLYELAQSFQELGRTDESWSALQQAVLARPDEPEPYLDLGRVTLAQVSKGVDSASPLQAIAALRGAIERAPDLAEAHGLLAQAQQLAGDAHGALQSYQRALHLAPLRTDWSLGLGQVCLELNHPEIAIASLQEALDHSPDDPAVHVALARAFAQNGLWPESHSAAQAARRLDPDNPQTVLLLAEAAAAVGDHASALAAWRAAVALSPYDVAMHTRLAGCLLDAGQADEARAAYAQALSIAPDSAEAHLAAGRAFLHLGEIEQAYQVLLRAVELAPHSAEIQAAFGQVASQANKFEAAHAAYLQAAELDNGRSRAEHLRQAGEALWSMNRLAAAVALWQRSASLNPHDHALRARLGLAQLQLGQPAEALESLEQALSQSPHDAHILREAARAALALDRPKRAAEHLQSAIELNPGDAEARFMFGQVREREGQPESALVLYRQAARISPDDGRYLAATADALAATGQPAEALDVMQHALRLSPDSAEVQQRAGELFLSSGRPREAVNAFQKCVEARPRDTGVLLALARALVSAAELGERSRRASLTAAAGSAALAEQDTANLHNRAVDAIQQAAALGAEAMQVRYWLGRAKAIGGDPREAQRLLESVAAAKVGPGPALPVGDLYRASGIALRRAGLLDRAREAFQSAAQRDDQPALAYLELGLVHEALGDHQAAASALKRAVAGAPDLAVAHYHLAQTLVAMSEPAEASRVILRALALNPEAAAWHYQLAKIYQDLADAGDHESIAAALGHFQRAAELEPGNALFTADLARALAHDGDLPAAAEQFRQATQASQHDDRLWTERGQIHLALRDLKAAGDCFAHALELAPASAAALLGGARVSLGLGDLNDALSKAEAAVRATPDEPEAQVCLAEVAEARGDFAGAERSYTLAAARAPQPAAALLALGRLQARQQKWDRALIALERAAVVDPADDEILAMLGEVQNALGNHPAAMKSYREAARIAPRQANHLLRLGRTCRAQGQLDQALSHLMQARELAPTDDEVLREIGLVFDQRKQYDRALEMYQLAIAAAPNAAANYTRAGIAYKNMKSYADAVNALERAVSLDSKNLEATKQLAVVSAMNLMQSSSMSHSARVHP